MTDRRLRTICRSTSEHYYAFGICYFPYCLTFISVHFNLFLFQKAFFSGSLSLPLVFSVNLILSFLDFESNERAA